MTLPWIESAPGAPQLASVLLRVTILLAAAWSLHAFLRRGNPLWRRSLWRGVLVGMAVIPVLVYLDAGVRIPLLPTINTAVVQEPDEDSADPASTVLARPGASPEGATPFSAAEERSTMDARSLAGTAGDPMPALQKAVNHEEETFLPGSLHRYWLSFLVLTWALGVAGLSARALADELRFRRWLRTTLAAPGGLCRELASVAKGLGLGRRTIALRTSTQVRSPLVTGVFQPVVVLPEAFVASGAADDVTGVLAHELAHVRSRDPGWTRLMQIAATLFWFHPLVWKVRRAHATACEEVCDTVAAGFVGDAEAYSGTLSRVALRALQHRPALGGIPMVRRPEIIERLRALRRHLPGSPPTRCAIIGFVVLGGLALAAMSCLEPVRWTPPVEQPGVSAPDAREPGTTEEISRLVEALRDDSLYPEVGGHFLGIHTRYGYMEWSVCSPPGSAWKKVRPAQALVDIGAPAVESLVKVLMEDHRLVSHAASEALVEIGTASIPALIDEMVHPLEGREKGEARVAAHGGSRRCGTQYYSPRGLLLIEPEDGKCTYTRFFFPSYPAQTLGRIGKPAVPHLLPLLGDRHRDVRANAAAALAIMATDAQDAIPGVIAILNDPDWLVRWVACEALRRMDVRLRESVPGLVATLGDPVCLVRQSAVRALGHVGSGAPSVVPAMMELLSTADDWHLRREIARSFERLGADSLPAGPAMLEKLRSIDWWRGREFREFVDAIAALGPEFVPEMATALNADSPNLRTAAVKALAAMGLQARDALPELIEALKRQDLGGRPDFGPIIGPGRLPRDPRAFAADALGNLGSAAIGALPALREVQANLGEPDAVWLPGLQQAIVDAMARITGDWSNPDLERSPLATRSRRARRPSPGERAARQAVDGIGPCVVVARLVHEKDPRRTALPIADRSHDSVRPAKLGDPSVDPRSTWVWFQFSRYDASWVFRGPAKGAPGMSTFSVVDPDSLGGERREEVLIVDGDTAFIDVHDAGRRRVHLEGRFYSVVEREGVVQGRKTGFGSIVPLGGVERILVRDDPTGKTYLEVTVSPEER